MSDDGYSFPDYSALFNVVDNSIFIRGGVANRVTKINDNTNGNYLKIRNETRLKDIIFKEIMENYNLRIRAHNLKFRQLSNDDKKNMSIMRFITFSKDEEGYSGSFMAYPRTFRCTTCNDYKVLFKDEWRNFDVKKCQNPDCDGEYEQVSILGFCETCGNVDTLRKPCPNGHGYKYLNLIQDDEESVSSWRLKCRKCDWEDDFKSYPCNHTNKFEYGNESICDEVSKNYELINVQRGGLFKSCVKTTVDVPSNNEDIEFIDEIIIGIYLGLFEEYNFESGKEQMRITQHLKTLDVYPDREDAIYMGIDSKLYDKSVSVKNKLIQINKDFEDYSIPDFVDYLILKEFVSEDINKSYDDYYMEFNDNLSKEQYEKFKEEFGIIDIIHIPDIQLISTSYGSIRGINKFYDLDFVPHFELHWIKEYNKPNGHRERFGVYAFPFETEGIMFDLDKLKIANWILYNFENNPDYFADEDDAKDYLFHLSENSVEYEALYTLIHSFSHVLIKRSPLFTGLDSDSCSELLFPKSGAFMIYSTSNVNIGGFSFLFENSLLEWFNDVKLDITDCVLDHSCIEDDGACFSCMYLPEFVCCRFNQYLDRDVFLGNYRFKKGFWNL